MFGMSPLSDVGGAGWSLPRYAELGAQICREIAEAHACGRCVGSITPSSIELNLADYPVVHPAADAPSATPEDDVAAVGDVLMHLFARAQGACPAELSAVLKRCRDGSYRTIDDVEHDLMVWVLNDQRQPSSWENLFLDGPEDSGARPALRRSLPPTTNLEGPVSVGDEPSVRPSRWRVRHHIVVVVVTLGVLAGALALALEI